jgi:hypothetical protein
MIKIQFIIKCVCVFFVLGCQPSNNNNNNNNKDTNNNNNTTNGAPIYSQQYIECAESLLDELEKSARDSQTNDNYKKAIEFLAYSGNNKAKDSAQKWTPLTSINDWPREDCVPDLHIDILYALHQLESDTNIMNTWSDCVMGTQHEDSSHLACSYEEQDEEVKVHITVGSTTLNDLDIELENLNTLDSFPDSYPVGHHTLSFQRQNLDHAALINLKNKKSHKKYCELNIKPLGTLDNYGQRTRDDALKMSVITQEDYEHYNRKKKFVFWKNIQYPAFTNLTFISDFFNPKTQKQCHGLID